jgi:hypothetical protein
MNFLSPFIQFLVAVVALLSAMVTVDRLYHYYVTVYFKFIARKDPLDDYPTTPLPRDMVRQIHSTSSPGDARVSGRAKTPSAGCFGISSGCQGSSAHSQSHTTSEDHHGSPCVRTPGPSSLAHVLAVF